MFAALLARLRALLTVTRAALGHLGLVVDALDVAGFPRLAAAIRVALVVLTFVMLALLIVIYLVAGATRQAALALFAQVARLTLATAAVLVGLDVFGQDNISTSAYEYMKWTGLACHAR